MDGNKLNENGLHIGNLHFNEFQALLIYLSYETISMYGFSSSYFVKQRHHKLQARNFYLDQTEHLLTSDVFKN